eukprot:CAMPEP_0195510152 /NCGR_PEP_ID=MMETSP0794_2-20130614/2889_1 /TAXON_ID=515487 /ORGANISM="Stephanopyxis turris, Strain CCMP 815" /LENGTH=193 /DNA_ID=CAMNT_0040637527 /DNA_START=230 /DNA_END=811 /DNA_ORIENTATION=-
MKSEALKESTSVDIGNTSSMQCDKGDGLLPSHSAPAAKRESRTDVTASKQDDKGNGGSSNSEYFDENGDYSSVSDTDDNKGVAQPFTVDPHILDKEIGQFYTVHEEVTITRPSLKDPWGLQLMIDCETDARTTTLRVGGRLGEECVHGMRKGDIIISVNGVKIGSMGVSNIGQLFLVMRESVEMKIGLIRKSS